MNRRTKPWAFAFAACAAFLAASAGAKESAAIEDVIATHHFVSIAGIFADASAKLMCVETADHQHAMWNPVTDKLSNYSDPRCKPGGSPKELHTMVGLRPLEGRPPQLAQRDASFSGSRDIYAVHGGGSAHCGGGDHHYLVQLPDGSLYPFYFIVRLKTPRTATINSYCEYADGDSRRTYTEQYTSETLHSIDMGNGTTLMYAHGDAAFGYPTVLLLVRMFPTTVWATTARDAFFIPQSELHPALNSAGPHPIDRNDALTKFLRPHQQ